MTCFAVRFAECRECTHANGNSFKVRNVAMHELSSYHITNVRANRSQSANVSQRWAKSAWQSFSWSGRRRSDAPVLGTHNSLHRTSNEGEDDSDYDPPLERDERSPLLRGSDNEDGGPGVLDVDFDEIFGEVGDELLRDWLHRPKDTIEFTLNPLLGEVFLAPFNHQDYPSNLEERRKDGGNFGRYRVVTLLEEEVQWRCCFA
jgi:hypothetical protein